MLENLQLSSGKAGCVDNARMHKLIEDEHVFLAHQSADDTHGGCITGRKSERRLSPFEGSQLFFQFVMQFQRTTNKA